MFAIRSLVSIVASLATVLALAAALSRTGRAHPAAHEVASHQRLDQQAIAVGAPQPWKFAPIRHPGRNQTVALCFFGLTRSLRITVPSIQEFLVQPLHAAGYNVDIYLHTYDLSYISSRWSNEHDALNASEWQVLLPLGLVQAEVTSQEQFLRDSRSDIVACESQGLGWADGSQVLRNHLCQLNSLARVSALWQRRHAAQNYTAVVYARPDVMFNCRFPVQLLPRLQPRTLYAPDHNKWTGLNDRFAILQPSAAMTYGNRLNYTFVQCHKPKARENVVHAERFVKKMADDEGLTAVDIPMFYFYRIRASGLAEIKDFMSQPGCDWNRLGELRIQVRHAAVVAGWHHQHVAQKSTKSKGPPR